MKNFLCSIFLVLIFSHVYAKSCDEYWNEFIDRHDSKPKYSEFLKYWKNEVGDGCKNTAGYYYYYYADTVNKQNNGKEGIKVSNYAIKKFPLSKYIPALKEVVLAIKTIENYRTKKRFKEVELDYINLLKEYPESSVVNAGYAASSLIYKDYKTAKTKALKSIELKPNKTAYLVLVQTAFNDDNYEGVINYANKAAKFDKYIYENRDVMLYVAISYAKMNKFETAENVLNILLSKNPVIKDDENFKYTVNYINYLYAKKSKEQEKNNKKGGKENAK